MMIVTPRIVISEEAEEAVVEEQEEMCWPFGNEHAQGSSENKNSRHDSVRPTVKVLDPETPNGFRDIVITVEKQNTGSFQIGTGVTTDCGLTGSITIQEGNTGNFKYGAGANADAGLTCGIVGELLSKYHRACADGRRAEATELAVRALAIDPMCFHTAGCETKCKGAK